MVKLLMNWNFRSWVNPLLRQITRRNLVSIVDDLDHPLSQSNWWDQDVAVRCWPHSVLWKLIAVVSFILVELMNDKRIEPLIDIFWCLNVIQGNFSSNIIVKSGIMNPLLQSMVGMVAIRNVELHHDANNQEHSKRNKSTNFHGWQLSL